VLLSQLHGERGVVEKRSEDSSLKLEANTCTDARRTSHIAEYCLYSRALLQKRQNVVFSELYGERDIVEKT